MSRHIGIVGLGTMGTIVSRRLALQGFSVSVYNRHLEGAEENVARDLMARYPELHEAKGFDQMAPFIESLPSPKVIYLMIHAGAPTQEVIDEIAPRLSPGDVLIDGGNAHFQDTTKRYLELKQKGIHFIGCGISGGIDGAVAGLSLMPGGSKTGYGIATSSLEALAAKSMDGSPCCAYIGEGGAGHFVKMVHNGIEYAEMELWAEVYSLLRWAVGLTPDVIADILAQWKTTEANGYLLEITLQILRQKNEDRWVIDSILDSAGQKGTGVWAVQAATSYEIPAMMMTAALHARYLSSQRHIRKHLDEVSASHSKKSSSVSTNDIFKAFQLSRFIIYQEGFSIIRAGARQYNWPVGLAEVCRLWTNGCIIRSTLMNHFVVLWQQWNDELILHPEVKGIISSGWPGLRRIIQVASAETIFTPCLVAASQYIAGASLRYPMANLVQAQRDYFGHHGFRSVDDPEGQLRHFAWKREEGN